MLAGQNIICGSYCRLKGDYLAVSFHLSPLPGFDNIIDVVKLKTRKDGNQGIAIIFISEITIICLGDSLSIL
jgi:hypothetical protein